jgi:hypothetical protein
MTLLLDEPITVPDYVPADLLPATPKPPITVTIPPHNVSVTLKPGDVLHLKGAHGEDLLTEAIDAGTDALTLQAKITETTESTLKKLAQAFCGVPADTPPPCWCPTCSSSRRNGPNPGRRMEAVLVADRLGVPRREVASVLSRAADVLDRDDWIKGTLHGEARYDPLTRRFSRPHCAMGAIEETGVNAEYQRAAARVLEVALGCQVPGWNDASHRRKEHVTGALREVSGWLR